MCSFIIFVKLGGRGESFRGVGVSFLTLRLGTISRKYSLLGLVFSLGMQAKARQGGWVGCMAGRQAGGKVGRRV